ncbi:MAG: flagellar basal body rod protein FlgC [Gammaproteobacteria bacterium]|nr:MAG: flagellar basal body rod protein FlgC [Gammaproteobacteria bacterium]
MSLFNVFNIAGSGMQAQTVRMNTTASNLANVDSVATTPEQAYKAKHPVFASVLNAQMTGGVKVKDIYQSDAEHLMRYEPNNPQSNNEGYVFQSNVNSIEEMVNMISASRSYQNNVEIMNTSKEMLTKTLSLGK